MKLLLSLLFCLVLLSCTDMWRIVAASRHLPAFVAGANHPSLLLRRSASKLTNSQRRAQQRLADNANDDADILSGYSKPTVQWYPGHIAKAERQLSETLKAVDVVVEVRDARICKATCHEKVGEWCAGSPRIVVLTHVDMVPASSVNSWKRSYEQFGAGKWDGTVSLQTRNQARQAQQERDKYAYPVSVHQQRAHQDATVSPVQDVLFVDAKKGEGIHALQRAIFKAGQHVQDRRERRGLKERALRVGIIGYPNVGKSALINRILGKKRAKTENTPGVTRSLQWIRVRSDDIKTSKKREFELLDSPGIIPAKMVDQSDAVLLAACNCIGDAAYDNQSVAAYLMDWLKQLHVMNKGTLTSQHWRRKCLDRYGFDPLEGDLNGDAMVYKVADVNCKGSPEDAARKILQDFRTGRMGPICLQLAPQQESDDGQVQVLQDDSKKVKVVAKNQYNWDEERLSRAYVAMALAKEQGLELPPGVENAGGDANGNSTVGKGLFEGW